MNFFHLFFHLSFSYTLVNFYSGNFLFSNKVYLTKKNYLYYICEVCSFFFSEKKEKLILGSKIKMIIKSFFVLKPGDERINYAEYYSSISLWWICRALFEFNIVNLFPYRRLLLKKGIIYEITVLIVRWIKICFSVLQS